MFECTRDLVSELLYVSGRHKSISWLRARWTASILRWRGCYEMCIRDSLKNFMSSPCSQGDNCNFIFFCINKLLLYSLYYFILSGCHLYLYQQWNLNYAYLWASLRLSELETAELVTWNKLLLILLFTNDITFYFTYNIHLHWILSLIHI